MTTERSNDNNAMSDLLKKFIENNKLDKGLDRVSVENAWKENMGSGVNRYTKRIYFENNILHVSLSSSVLREELSYGKQKIIDMLNDELGKNLIKDLKLH